MLNLGFVEMDVLGLNLEKFLNTLKDNKVIVSNVYKKEFNKFCIKVPYSNYKKFLEVSDKLCYNISVNKVTGPIKIFNFFKTRFALCISLICAIVLMFFSNKFIFQFEISGNTNITNDEICELLNENDIGFGTLKSNLVLKDIQNLLLKNFDELSLVSCSIVGNTLFINIKESIVVDNEIKDFIYE